MLKSLFIENIAVIEKASVNFAPDFNVLTGETGAGKSIIIDSINAVLGERTSKELIRAGCKNAVVSAVFSDLNLITAKVLEENGFLPDENGEYTIQRVFSLSSSNIKINGQPVTSAVLRSFSNRLINIHGQHDNQALLQPENHYKYLDMIAENDDILEKYKNEFKRFNKLRTYLKKIDIDEEEKLRKIDIIKYQIEEISSAEVTVGEYDKLKENFAVAKDAEKHKQELNDILYLLKGDDNNNGVISALTEISKILGKENLKKLNSFSAPVDSSIDLTENLRAAAENYIDEISSGIYEIDNISDRIELLNSLFQKYGNSEEKLLKFLENKENELQQIEFNDDEIERVEKELENSKNRLVEFAGALTLSRKKAAAKFENQVSEVLYKLNMPSVKIHTEFKEGRYTRNGCDEVQFLLSANAGELLKPLSKIASGGELSRIMLAIKSVLSKKDDVDTLIFDEIDTGISGKAADKVGELLKKVSNDRQVICVTHLAQIAACSKNHFLIEKTEQNGRTFTDVKLLKGDKRVYEIARIMGGSKISDSLISSAEEIIKANI